MQVPILPKRWGEMGRILSQGITNNNDLLVVVVIPLCGTCVNQKDSQTGGYKYTIERPDNLNVDLGATARCESYCFWFN